MLHVLEFDVVSGGNLAFSCRDCFHGTAKIDFKWGTVEVICFHYFVDKSMIIPVAVINGRPRTVFTLTWGPVAMTKEVALPSLVK